MGGEYRDGSGEGFGYYELVHIDLEIYRCGGQCLNAGGFGGRRQAIQ